MLMLQPPGRDSTYRFLLPRVAGCKHGVDVMPPIWAMRPERNRCMHPNGNGVCAGGSYQKVTFRFVRHLADLPYGTHKASAMMSPP